MAHNFIGKFTVSEELRSVLLDFTVSFLMEQPRDVLDFGIEFFQRKLEMKLAQRATVTGDLPMDDLTTVDSEEETSVPVTFDRRKSVFAEGLNPDDVDEDDDQPRQVTTDKTDEQKRALSEILKNTLLFKPLDSEQLDEVINAMFVKRVAEGETVIEEGEDGDNFYVIQSGIFYALKMHGGEQRLVHTYEHKGSFGELALLYNVPRAATVKAGSDGALWAMDRNTFRRIVLKNAFKKRKLYEALIECVPMLQTLASYERMTLTDALEPRSFKDGEQIIKQGDSADGMYFVESGMVSIRIADDFDAEVEVKIISKGGYFGELALVSHSKRAASAYAVGPVKVAFLDVEAFERLLGPCMEIMKRSFEDYEAQLVKVFGYNPKQGEIRSSKSTKKVKSPKGT